MMQVVKLLKFLRVSAKGGLALQLVLQQCMPHHS